MTVNGRIVLLRYRLGLSQKAFAERIGRSAAYLNRVENNHIEPTQELLERIVETFGVDKAWLTAGVGRLEVESVGDRIKAVRKARGYTQAELAEEIHISRNSVGMIERGTFRPGEEVIDSLCDTLWVDKSWLLTGQGKMERTELTPFYAILRQDPRVRAHIRSFIDHLDRPYPASAAEREELEENNEAQEEKWTTAYVVNDANESMGFDPVTQSMGFDPVTHLSQRDLTP